MAPSRALALLALLCVAAIADASVGAAGVGSAVGAAGVPRRGLRLFRTKDEEVAHKKEREQLVTVRAPRPRRWRRRAAVGSEASRVRPAPHESGFAPRP